MSQYLQFYLKQKESDTQLCIGYFCTTPARQIADTGAFPYIENNTPLTEEQMEHCITILKNEAQDCVNHLKEYTQCRLEMQENLYKCVSKEVAEIFLEKIDDYDSAIKEYTEEIEDWNWRINKITNILEIYEDNKDKWDLFYINC